MAALPAVRLVSSALLPSSESRLPNYVTINRSNRQGREISAEQCVTFPKLVLSISCRPIGLSHLFESRTRKKIYRAPNTNWTWNDIYLFLNSRIVHFAAQIPVKIVSEFQYLTVRPANISSYEKLIWPGNASCLDTLISMEVWRISRNNRQLTLGWIGMHPNR